MVRRGLAPSRSEAQRAIEQGIVNVAGMPAGKPATMVDRSVSIALAAQAARFVSRGGDKLDGALERLGVSVGVRRWLDAGASTGGFTDRLLQGGATGVIALDVGYGQLDWSLRSDERVTVMERTNVRSLSRTDLPFTPEGVVADLSFISLVTVLPALAEIADDGGDMVLLVKPQFEVGRADVGKGGVVRDPVLWRAAILKVIDSAAALGWGLAGVTYSSPPGPSGNREFFVHLRKDGGQEATSVDLAIEEAP